MNIRSNLVECKKYAENIMPQIICVLDQNSYHYMVDEAMTEIVIPDADVDKDEIQDLIESSLDIPKVITGMLTQIKKVKDRIYIRLVLK